jgi:hypothetical protein
MNKQATIFVFCGLVATAFGQWNDQWGGRALASNFNTLDEGNIIAAGAQNA